MGVPVAGRIRKLLVAPGDAVRAGQPIAAVVSPEAAMIYAELEVSRAQAKLVDGQYRRMLPLAKKGYLPWQELENKRIEIVRANAEVRAAAAKASTADSPDASGNVLFKSPISGQVTAVKMLPGSFVQAGEVVAEISNPGATELHFVVTPILGESIKVGELLRVTAGSREFQARVTSVGSGGSGANRGTLLRAQPINATTPPAGTAVTAFPVVNAADIRLTVPSGAVQTLNGSPVVFLYEKGVARPLSVAIGKQTGGRTEILSGLKGGETLAGSNTYVLKTELERSRP
ncbi:efflux RND transporter periplasmic adaptor subunit [Synechococcus sp. CS-601]|nr:efflux RND transporter periplasmic adaptor subunit [Synechococcus sp. CS-601]